MWIITEKTNMYFKVVTDKLMYCGCTVAVPRGLRDHNVDKKRPKSQVIAGMCPCRIAEVPM